KGSSLLDRLRVIDVGGGWPCHFATVSRSSPSLRAMAASDIPRSARTWIWFHCCILINPLFLRGDVAVARSLWPPQRPSQTRGFSRSLSTGAGFYTILSAGFLAITSAGFLT